MYNQGTDTQSMQDQSRDITLEILGIKAILEVFLEVWRLSKAQYTFPLRVIITGTHCSIAASCTGTTASTVFFAKESY
eukprot:scaffold25986_cov77-Cyclotella_meneghiniana.AAC.4